MLVCAVRGTLYAYRDACAGVRVLARRREARPRGADLPGLRRAATTSGWPGRGLDDDPALHLDPLPLLADSQGVRVALPETIRA